MKPSKYYYRMKILIHIFDIGLNINIYNVVLDYRREQ